MLDARGLTLSSGLGTSTLPWASISEVWRFDDCWLLMLSSDRFAALPTADLGNALTDYLIERVATAGVALR